jgi:hypothetical protein
MTSFDVAFVIFAVIVALGYRAYAVRLLRKLPRERP